MRKLLMILSIGTTCTTMFAIISLAIISNTLIELDEFMK